MSDYLQANACSAKAVHCRACYMVSKNWLTNRRLNPIILDIGVGKKCQGYIIRSNQGNARHIKKEQRDFHGKEREDERDG